MNQALRKKLKKIPQKSGVYLFKDSSGRIIYIGKAQNLKKRAQSHFAKKNNFFSSQFIEKSADLDWISTRNEKEAFLLENQLIKKYQPRHNIQWRDDKSYFWVKFTPTPSLADLTIAGDKNKKVWGFSDDEWPRVQVVHNSKIGHELKVMAAGLVNSQKLLGKNLKPKAIDQTGHQDQKLKTVELSPIGPFTSGRELRQVLRALRRIIPYRTCKNIYTKPCLQWHLGLCPAHRSLGEGGPAHGTDLRFKNYDLRVKKYLISLDLLTQFLRLYASERIRIEAYDISNIQGKFATGSMIVFYGDKPKKSDYRKFRIKTVHDANDVAMIREVLRRRLAHREWPYPDLMLIDGGRAQLAAAQHVANSLWRIVNRKISEPYAISYTPLAIIALAKKEEEIYTEYSDKPLKISCLPQPLKLTFQHIRNEAHRFAIFYYRYLHGQVVKNRQVRHRRTEK